MALFYLEKVLGGETAYFSFFLKEYKHMAYTISFRILRNKEDAEEAVQDSFLKAYKSLHKFRHDAKFSTWFYRIVVNTSLSKVRKREAEATETITEGISDDLIESVAMAYNNLAKEERRNAIDLALGQLETEARLLLTLYYLNENSIDEVGEITGISVDNVKMKLHRARKKMYFVLSKMTKSEINPFV